MDSSPLRYFDEDFSTLNVSHGLKRGLFCEGVDIFIVMRYNDIEVKVFEQAMAAHLKIDPPVFTVREGLFLCARLFADCFLPSSHLQM